MSPSKCSAAGARHHQTPPERVEGRLDLVELRGMTAVEQSRYLRGLPAQPLRQLAFVEPRSKHRAVGFELGRGQSGQSRDRAPLCQRRSGYVLAMRHSPEDHLVEKISGLSERFLASLALAPDVGQVGKVDDEAAFLGRDQIDRPCRWAGYPFHVFLLSQIAAPGRHMRDAIAALDPDMAALPAARDDPDIAAPAQPPKQFVCRHSDRSAGLRINRRPEISH
jgi:hypothetical protein